MHLLTGRVEKANQQVITRSRTGNLPPSRQTLEVGADASSKTPAVPKATAEEIKEKMEQQLRLQRAAHQQKRALELKTPQGQVIKMVGTTAQGKFLLFLRYKNACLFLPHSVTPGTGCLTDRKRKTTIYNEIFSDSLN